MLVSFIKIKDMKYVKITDERVWIGRVHSLFSKVRSPPYCRGVLLDPGIVTYHTTCTNISDHIFQNIMKDTNINSIVIFMNCVRNFVVVSNVNLLWTQTFF